MCLCSVSATDIASLYDPYNFPITIKQYKYFARAHDANDADDAQCERSRVEKYTRNVRIAAHAWNTLATLPMPIISSRFRTTANTHTSDRAKHSQFQSARQPLCAPPHIGRLWSITTIAPIVNISYIMPACAQMRWVMMMIRAQDAHEAAEARIRIDVRRVQRSNYKRIRAGQHRHRKHRMRIAFVVFFSPVSE